MLLALGLVGGCIGSGADEADAAACEPRSVLPAEPGAAPDDVHVAVRVTRDHGSIVMRDATVELRDGWTVMDVLMRVADVETAFGGGFVRSIDGIASTYPSGDEDWFFEVDGVVSGIGAAQWRLAGSERIHWDFHSWTQTPYLAHFDSFPWTTARVLVTASAQPWVPSGLAARAEPWSGQWTDGAAVLVTGADEAPWDALPRIRGGGCAGLHDEPWSAALRVVPGTSPRAVLIGEAAEPPMPDRGLGWILTAGNVLEVVDA